jgi:hypothetical protein
MTRLRRNIKVLVRELEKHITFLPHGYVFWYSLPEKGVNSRKVVKARWEREIYNAVYSEELRYAVLKACVKDDGLLSTEGKELYKWAVKWLYSGKEHMLYKDWISKVKDTK